MGVARHHFQENLNLMFPETLALVPMMLSALSSLQQTKSCNTRSSDGQAHVTIIEVSVIEA